MALSSFVVAKGWHVVRAYWATHEWPKDPCLKPAVISLAASLAIVWTYGTLRLAHYQNLQVSQTRSLRTALVLGGEPTGTALAA